jgi:hypothetical protein
VLLYSCVHIRGVQSVVLISKLPLIVLFTQLVEIIALEYFDTGEASIEAGERNYRCTGIFDVYNRCT